MKTLTIRHLVSGYMSVDVIISGNDDDALDDAIQRAQEICQRDAGKLGLSSPSCEFDEVIDEEPACSRDG